MINAKEARRNQENYYVELNLKVESQVMTVIEKISASIEFHSRNGFDYLELMPYGASLFPSITELETAAEIFNRILTENGYKVVKNDYNNNYMKIQW